jgi:hypothetical protein
MPSGVILPYEGVATIPPVPIPAGVLEFATLASGWGTTYTLPDLIDLIDAWLVGEWP